MIVEPNASSHLTNRRRCRRHTRKRRGIATMEFVMSLPVLFVLMAMIFTLGMRMRQQMEVTMHVRDRAWLKRTGVEASTSASAPFEFGSATTGGMSAKKKKEWRKYPWLGGERTSKNKTSLIAGTWDHRQVPELRGGGPHASALGKLGQGGAGAMSSLARLLDF